MRQIILLSFWAFLAYSCDGEKECAAFDRSLEIAKWHLFPALDSVYTFSSDSLEISLTQERGILSESETLECGFMQSCDCLQLYLGYYRNDSHYIRSNIGYDQDGDPIYRRRIFYEFDDIHAYFEVTSSGEMLRVADDTTSAVPFIEFENLENVTIDELNYQEVLHLTMPEQSEISDYWIARNFGLIAFQKDSILYTKE